MLCKRPLSFFGPECCDLENWKDERLKIIEAQLEWDAKYDTLSWFQQLLCNIYGKVTEPLYTSEGKPIESMVEYQQLIVGKRKKEIK